MDSRLLPALALFGVVASSEIKSRVGPGRYPIPDTRNANRLGSRSFGKIGDKGAPPAPTKKLQGFNPKFSAWIRSCWQKAVALWGFVDITPAMQWVKEEDWRGPDYIAFIDLSTRQVWVNYDRLRKDRTLKSLTALFAHELGHHMRWPGSLKEQAKYDLLQKDILPNWEPDLTNLFQDLLINEHVGRAGYWQDLASVYRQVRADKAALRQLQDLESKGYRVVSMDAAEFVKQSIEARRASIPPAEFVKFRNVQKKRAEAAGYTAGKTLSVVLGPDGKIAGEIDDKAAEKAADNAMTFYLGCYEHLWGLPYGELSGPAAKNKMGREHPDWQRDTERFVSLFFHGSSELVDRFYLFCKTIEKYLEEPKEEQEVEIEITLDGTPGGGGPPGVGGFPWDEGKKKIKVRIRIGGKGPLNNDTPPPGIDDLIEEIFRRGRHGDLAEERIRNKGRSGRRDEEGEQGGEGLQGSSSGELMSIERDLDKFPEDQRKPLMMEAYKRLVEKYLFEPPRKRPPPEPEIPTGFEMMEPWEDLAGVDWLYTLTKVGDPRLSAVEAYRKSYEPDLVKGRGKIVPYVEIYLDTSGSMPNPFHAINAMTVAALVLGVAAVRAGARVRGIIWSDRYIKSDWLYSESSVLAYLLNYVGGGTSFPFDFAAKSAQELQNDHCIRVVVTDDGFLGNVESLKHQGGGYLRGSSRRDTRDVVNFEKTVDQSELFVALTYLPGDADEKDDHWSRPEALGTLGELTLKHPKLKIVRVGNLHDFGAAAAALSRGLFPAGSSARGPKTREFRRPGQR